MADATVDSRVKMAKRFADHSEDEILKKRKASIPSNTEKSNKSVADTLKQYLAERKQDTNFEDFDEVKLAEVLGHFYMDARTSKGELYKKKGIESLRYSINRYLKAPPVLKKFDIISSPTFNDSNELYKTATKEIKEAGKGNVAHYKKISDNDLVKLYHSVHLAPNTPTGLMNRVQMNVRLYFCRRGNEIMEKMTKTTFKVATYNDGRRYIFKNADEITKNRREDDTEIVTTHMPEEDDNETLCPVATFLKYLSKLNPKCDRLWQLPNNVFCDEDEVWYQNRPLGRDTMGKFMSNLSTRVPLSQVYTNHCVRVTGTSILSRKNFSAAQIMSVTGHKSVSSLSIYQRVSDTEKSQMGTAISHATGSSVTALPACQPLLAIEDYQASTSMQRRQPLQILPVSNQAASLQVLPASDTIDHLQGVSLDDLLSDYDSLTTVTQFNNSLNLNQNQRRAPIFQGCTISGLTININVNK